jgi:hypothetical protein
MTIVIAYGSAVITVVIGGSEVQKTLAATLLKWECAKAERANA